MTSSPFIHTLGEALRRLRSDSMSDTRTLGDVQRNAALWFVLKAGVPSNRTALAFPTPLPAVEEARLGETPYVAALGYLLSAAVVPVALPVPSAEVIVPILRRSPRTLERSGLVDDPVSAIGLMEFARAAGAAESAAFLTSATVQRLAEQDASFCLRALAVAVGIRDQELGRSLVSSFDNSRVQDVAAAVLLFRTDPAFAAANLRGTHLDDLENDLARVLCLGQVTAGADLDSKLVLAALEAIMHSRKFLQEGSGGSAERPVQESVSAVGLTSGHGSAGSSPGVSGVLRSRFDVAVICALHSPELEKVRNVNNRSLTWSNHTVPGDAHRYLSTTLRTRAGRDFRVVASAPTQMGLVATAVLATKLVLYFRPSLLVMVGIAAGTKASGRNFGDILIAKECVDYESGKITLDDDGNEVFLPDPRPIAIPTPLLTLLQMKAANRDYLDEIKSAWPAKKPDASLAVHVGPLGSADRVVDSAARIADVRKHWRKLIGIEMETYAVFRAAIDSVAPPPNFLSIKSVCDFAHDKEDGWQEYAAYTAAEYAYKILFNDADEFVTQS